jgi:hypothetical protein
MPTDYGPEFWIFVDDHDVTVGVIALHDSPAPDGVLRMTVSARGHMIDFDLSANGVDEFVTALQNRRQERGKDDGV